MTFALRFALLVLCIVGIHGQQNGDSNPSGNVGKGYPFGTLRLSEDGQKEQLISGSPNGDTQLKQDQTSNVQPLPSPCVGTRSSAKLPYPGDKSKYIQCRDEFHYEIFSCPNGGEFNEERAACDAVTPTLDRCAEEKPCLNGGQCTVLSNSSFKCTCRPDWTGDRCETPINSCVRKPCGPNAECRILKSNDYDQDYVCVCHSKRGYGLSCREVVPNPCLKGTDQFFPFAFSQHAYIQCDGDIVYFQPCGPLLYWNQEEKVCDRKRPPKLNLSALLKSYGPDKDNSDESTTTTSTEASVDGGQTDSNTRFLPAKTPYRQQGLFGQNQQPPTGTVQNQPAPSGGYKPMTQDSQTRSDQWSNQPSSQTYSQPPQRNEQYSSQQWSNQAPSMNTPNEQRFVSRPQSWQNQQQMQDTSDEVSTTTTTTTIQTTLSAPKSQGRNFQSWQTQPNNQWNNNQGAHAQPWQNFQGGNNQQSTFTTTLSPVNLPSWQTQPNNQWSNHQGVPSQTWQNFQGAGNPQPLFTTTTQSTITAPSWQHQPNNQWNNNQNTHSQSWQNFQGVGNQQSTFTTTQSSVNVPSWQHQSNGQWNTNQGFGNPQPFFTTTTTAPSSVYLPSWQTQPNNQWNNNQGLPSQTWQNFQGTGNQQSTFTTTPSSFINGQPWQNQWNTQQGVPSQPWQNGRKLVTQQPILPPTTTTTTTTPSTVNASLSQDQPMDQDSQSYQDQSPSEAQTMTFSNETTTTTPSTVVPSPNPTWQDKSSSQRSSTPSTLTIGFQPQQNLNVRPLTQPRQSVPTVSTQQPIPPTSTTTTPPTNIPLNNQWNNNQPSQNMGVIQQRGVRPIQNSLDQTPSWSQNNVNTQAMMNQRNTPDTGYWNNRV